MAHSKWFERNNFEENMDYTLKVLLKFDIRKHHFVNDSYGNLALLIDYGINSYRIETNDSTSEVEIYKKCIRRTGQRHPKEYLKLIKTFKIDCIYESIKFVHHDSVIWGYGTYCNNNIIT